MSLCGAFSLTVRRTHAAEEQRGLAPSSSLRQPTPRNRRNLFHAIAPMRGRLQQLRTSYVPSRHPRVSPSRTANALTVSSLRQPELARIILVFVQNPAPYSLLSRVPSPRIQNPTLPLSAFIMIAQVDLQFVCAPRATVSAWIPLFVGPLTTNDFQSASSQPQTIFEE